MRAIFTLTPGVVSLNSRSIAGEVQGHGAEAGVEPGEGTGAGVGPGVHVGAGAEEGEEAGTTVPLGQSLEETGTGRGEDAIPAR